MGLRSNGMRAASVLLTACVGTVVPATAGSMTESDNVVALYLWASSIDGDITVGNVTVPVDVSFTEILDDLDIAAFVHYERGARPWGFSFDTMYVGLSSDFASSGGAVTGTVEMQLWEAEAAAVRRFGGDAGKPAVELLLGARYWWLEQTVAPSMLTPVEGDQDWLDGFVGARLLAPLGTRWLFSLRLDVGAGGSDITWNGAAMFDWNVSRRTTLLFGLRYLHEDYEDADGSRRIALDMNMAGPVAGVAFRW